MGQAIGMHTYRLRTVEDDTGGDLEFEAIGPEMALHRLPTFCGDRRAELFEDGRKLVTLQLSSPQGFWIVGGDDRP